MTRFARAKGSKASNEKLPEDGTPWEVMKEQLFKAKNESDESKKRAEAEKQRLENYENFLKEQKVQKRKAAWCDFPETDNNGTNCDQIKRKKLKKNNKKNLNNGTETHEKSKNMNDIARKNIFEGEIEQKDVIESKPLEFDISNVEQVASLINKKNKKKKNKKQLRNNNINESECMNQNNNNENQVQAQLGSSDDKCVILNETKNKKKKKIIKTVEENQKKSTDLEAVTNDNKSLIGSIKQNHKSKNKKDKKLIDGKPIRRKLIKDPSFQLIINGKEIELIRFDGFPIMKKDAERLQELKSNMIKKGIPKSEVQRTIKLERRRAEKALARLKREVCYNCRMGGHNLSDCPELKSKNLSGDAAEGICFKCGSTEHRQFECKVQRDKEFRFATCFICKETGHIARQCPDNPKGLYPNGGSCKLCGDVTHLKKDCSANKDKKESTSIKLQTLDNVYNIEDVDQKINTTVREDSVKKPKKIKFY